MLINCIAYQDGKKLADIPIQEISDYLAKPDCFVWVALKDPSPEVRAAAAEALETLETAASLDEVLLALKKGGHPVTFQYTPRQLIEAAKACGFRVEEFTYIPRGAFLLQFGYVWPSVLTPARPIKLVLRKGEMGVNKMAA